MRTVWTRFRRHLADFRRANAGNVAMTFALSTLPLVGTEAAPLTATCEPLVVV